MNPNKAQGESFRQVDRGERNGSPTHIIRAYRSYPTTLADLWSALTQRERLQRWFANVAGNFKKGGRFAIEGNAEGEIVNCEPRKLLALTWEFDGNISWVSVTIKETDEGSLLTLEHEHPTDPESQAHWDQYGPGAAGVGWELAMLGLNMHLTGDGSSTLEAGEKWAASTTGKATLRMWSEAWGQAHVETGTDVQVAMDTAERTAAFYTGEAQ